MDREIRKNLETLPDADNKKWLRIDKMDKEMEKFMRNIYYKISTLKMKLDKLDFNSFDGDYQEFSTIKNRLTLAIKEEEDKLKYAEDMQNLYDKELPISADNYKTRTNDDKDMFNF